MSSGLKAIARQVLFMEDDIELLGSGVDPIAEQFDT